MNFLAIITPLIILAVAAYLGGWVLPGRNERPRGENAVTADERSADRPLAPSIKRRPSMDEEERLVASR